MYVLFLKACQLVDEYLPLLIVSVSLQLSSQIWFLTDNIIDQNHFGNTVRTSLSNCRNSLSPIRFCNSISNVIKSNY